MMDDMLKFEGEIKPTPEIVAKLIWAMSDDEQAAMLDDLYSIAGGEHMLMMQFLSCRKRCEERDDNSLVAFQAMFSSAFKYMW